MRHGDVSEIKEKRIQLTWGRSGGAEKEKAAHKTVAEFLA